VRRLTLLFAGGAVWLFLAAVPVFADGGPHIASLNSGTAGINADSCAGCHRAHTAQGNFLLVSNEATLCTTCHGNAGLGATTDVQSGLQYVPTSYTLGGRTTTVLGALRNGGFESAYIGSGSAYSVAYTRASTGEISFRTKVPALPVTGPGEPVNSTHMDFATGEGTGNAWGNGPIGSGVGASVTIECTTCHNPHGNGNYRILNPVPKPADAGFVATTGTAIVLDNSANANVVRNYTIIQASNGTTLTAQQVVTAGYSNNSGDYLHRVVPWDTGVYTYPQPATANDAPNGISASFGSQIAAWCITCHSRYASQGWSVKTADPVFTYRHTTQNNARNCVTCHVSHGSNAEMTGYNSTHVAYPNTDGTGGTYSPFASTGSTDSRLLKIDNRGTCQACHDPTGTVVQGQVRPTGASAPIPYLP
jgi:predicted CXXCH cytochrome family protein